MRIDTNQACSSAHRLPLLLNETAEVGNSGVNNGHCGRNTLMSGRVVVETLRFQCDVKALDIAKQPMDKQ
ncbi:MAG: hypothetical protein BGO79_04875 [Delftia sp. 67-8]|nr:MAG: hypothetical protein BGO79_04875 [Delftia sp. 67-8]